MCLTFVLFIPGKKILSSRKHSNDQSFKKPNKHVLVIILICSKYPDTIFYKVLQNKKGGDDLYRTLLQIFLLSFFITMSLTLCPSQLHMILFTCYKHPPSYHHSVTTFKHFSSFLLHPNCICWAISSLITKPQILLFTLSLVHLRRCENVWIWKWLGKLRLKEEFCAKKQTKKKRPIFRVFFKSR